MTIDIEAHAEAVAMAAFAANGGTDFEWINAKPGIRDHWRRIVIAVLLADGGCMGGAENRRTMELMVVAIETDRCDGDSEWAAGVNAACKQHSKTLRSIMAEHEPPNTEVCGNERR